MGQVALVLALILAAGVAMFSVQNAGPVLVRFGFWSVELSLVVVILVAVALGAMLASLIGLPGWFRDRRRLRQQAKQIEALRASQPSVSPPPVPVSPAPVPRSSDRPPTP